MIGTDVRAELVLNWRFEVLRRAGYGEEAALAVARADTDLHVAVALVERGCPEATAVRILL